MQYLEELDVLENIKGKKLSSMLEFIDGFPHDIVLSGLQDSERVGALSIKESLAHISFNIKSVDEYREICSDKCTLSACVKSKTSHCKYKLLLPYQQVQAKTSQQNEMSSFNCTITTSHLFDERWERNENYFYRLAIPIERCFWFNVVQTEGYRIVDGKLLFTSVQGLIDLHSEYVKAHIYPIDTGIGKFMVVESRMPCKYEVISRYTYSISMALGIVASTAPFDFSFIFASKQCDFQEDVMIGFRQLRKTIKMGYKFIATDLLYVKNHLMLNNAGYAWTQIKNNGFTNDGYRKEVNRDDFENIVNSICADDELKRCALILLEASTMSLAFMGELYSVALETLCNLYLKERKNKKTAEQRKKWHKVQMKISEAIVELQKEGIIDESVSGRMRKRIDQLINTSQKERLREPFEMIGYTLNENEEAAIDSRNTFLHGDIIKGSDESDNRNKLQLMSLELQKLCAKLLLNKCGFTGHILNNAVLLGCQKAIDNTEPVFVKREFTEWA